MNTDKRHLDQCSHVFVCVPSVYLSFRLLHSPKQGLLGSSPREPRGCLFICVYLCSSVVSCFSSFAGDSFPQSSSMRDSHKEASVKAAIVREYKQPLQIEETPRPSPGADEVLIQVEACGVCHSDLHIAEGDWTHLLRIIKRPLIPGHEVVGSIVQKGDSVNSLEIGDRVGVAWTHWTCGECDLCTEGLENLCSKQMI